MPNIFRLWFDDGEINPKLKLLVGFYIRKKIKGFDKFILVEGGWHTCCKGLFAHLSAVWSLGLNLSISYLIQCGTTFPHRGSFMIHVLNLGHASIISCLCKDFIQHGHSLFMLSMFTSMIWIFKDYCYTYPFLVGH